tara:strand:- start:55 stop:345 length:291 start_codon:yes stop_codon:yes gene_type:complete
MIIATMDTENFNWMAVGTSEALAKELIVKAFRKHLKECRKVTPTWPLGYDKDTPTWPSSNAKMVTALEDWYGIGIYEGGLGTAWRDDSIIIGKTSS